MKKILFTGGGTLGHIYPAISFIRKIKEKYKDTLKDIDILIDGKFILEKRDVTLQLRGSANQRIIDCKKSLKSERIFLYDE